MVQLGLSRLLLTFMLCWDTWLRTFVLGSLLITTKPVFGAVTCYRCSDRKQICNSGECVGSACFKIESKEKNQISVEKGCLTGVHRANCIKTTVLGLETVKCVCSYQWCNGESELLSSGLQRFGNFSLESGPKNPVVLPESHHTATKEWTANYICMIVFLCFFLAGVCFLFFVNVRCVQDA